MTSSAFGRVLTAMVTPFTPSGELDLAAAQSLATRLVDLGNDGLVISGTTGEAPTTTDAEKDLLLRAVVEAVGGRAHVLAGVGTYATAHTVELARSAEKAGATGLLVVTPYYSKPSQEGLVAHFTAVADATDLPVMLYDIPGRTGTAIDTETFLRLAAHPRVVANKDAKADVWAAQQVLARCDLDWYSGDDALFLPLLAVGAVGVVSVTGHLVADRHAALVTACDEGRYDDARALNATSLPLTVGLMEPRPGAVMTKAALSLLGVEVGPVRLPLVDATEAQRDVLRHDLTDGGLL